MKDSNSQSTHINTMNSTRFLNESYKSDNEVIFATFGRTVDGLYQCLIQIDGLGSHHKYYYMIWLAITYMP